MCLYFLLQFGSGHSIREDELESSVPAVGGAEVGQRSSELELSVPLLWRPPPHTFDRLLLPLSPDDRSASRPLRLLLFCGLLGVAKLLGEAELLLLLALLSLLLLLLLPLLLLPAPRLPLRGKPPRTFPLLVSVTLLISRAEPAGVDAFPPTPLLPPLPPLALPFPPVEDCTPAPLRPRLPRPLGVRASISSLLGESQNLRQTNDNIAWLYCLDNTLPGYIKHDQLCPLHGYNVCYTDAMSATRIQCLLHGYNVCYTDTMSATRIQCLLHGYNVCYSDAMSSTKIQYPVQGYNIQYKDTISSTRIQYPVQGYNVQYKDTISSTRIQYPVQGYNIQYKDTISSTRIQYPVQGYNIFRYTLQTSVSRAQLFQTVWTVIFSTITNDGD